jgi:hypothetical protein
MDWAVFWATLLQTNLVTLDEKILAIFISGPMASVLYLKPNHSMGPAAVHT